MAFVSSSNNNTSSTNEAVNTAHGVSTVSTQVNAANSTNIDNLSDAVICAFFASQPNSPQLVHEDLQQIQPDDMKDMDLRWQMAMLNMKARSPKWSATTATRGDILLGSVELEISTSTALVSYDGLGGYDWSDQAEEGPNYAFMAFSSSNPDSKVSNDSFCLKSYLKTIESLKSQNDQLLKDLKKSQLMVLGYKTGLESVEEKLEVYKANESIYLQDIKGLKFKIHIGEMTIRELRKNLDIVQKETDGIQFNVEKFKHASKSLNKLIECQIVDNCKKGLGYENYNAVPPPYTGNFMPPTPDLSFIVKKNDDTPCIGEWVSHDEEEDVSQPKIEKKTVRPSIVKKEFGNPQINLQDQGVIDSGCSRHMTGNMSYLTDYEEIDGGYVAFGGNPKGGKITGKCTIKTDHLGKFDGKADEGFFVGYSLNSKAFRVFNSRTRIVEENLHIRFSESTPNAVSLEWFAGTKASDNAGQARKETEPVKDYILLPLWTADLPFSQDPKSSHDDGSKPSSDDGKKVDEDPRKESECNDQEKKDYVNSTNNVHATSTNEVNTIGGKISIELPFDPNMSTLEDDSIFDFSKDDEDDGAVADMNNLDTTIQRFAIKPHATHKKMSKNLEEHGFISTIQQRANHKRPSKLLVCLAFYHVGRTQKGKFICMKDPSWIEAIQEELLQFKLQEVWTLVDLLNEKRAIGSKWVFRNKKDERGIVIRNKARLVAQGYTQEEGIDYG
ncbi:retrovirus-related pol polyprotein from transposon TNT 1-94 [Tanacetum coccineum]